MVSEICLFIFLYFPWSCHQQNNRDCFAIYEDDELYIFSLRIPSFSRYRNLVLSPRQCVDPVDRSLHLRTSCSFLRVCTPTARLLPASGQDGPANRTSSSVDIYTHTQECLWMRFLVDVAVVLNPIDAISHNSVPWLPTDWSRWKLSLSRLVFMGQVKKERLCLIRMIKSNMPAQSLSSSKSTCTANLAHSRQRWETSPSLECVRLLVQHGSTPLCEYKPLQDRSHRSWNQQVHLIYRYTVRIFLLICSFAPVVVRLDS